MLRRVLREPPEGATGQYVYSNLGYMIAGEMLAAATDRTYEQALIDLVFEPLGIEPAEVLLGVAAGPEAIGGHKRNPPRPAPEGADNPALMSPAGTFSYSLSGYAKFLNDQVGGHGGDDRALLPPERYERMREVPEGANHALGWAVLDDGKLIHSGSNTFWHATTIIDPEAEVAAAILANNGASDGLEVYVREALELSSAEK